MHMHTCIYIYLHNSCIRACATVQQLPCHGSYYELILSLARTSCRLSFPPALLPLRRAGRPSAGPLTDLFAKKSVQIHASSWRGRRCSVHEHHLIIRVGAGLIQFVYGSHSRMVANLTLDKNLFCCHFCGVYICKYIIIHIYMHMHIYMYIFKRIHTNLHICIFVYIYICNCMSKFIFINMYIYICMYIHINVYIYIYVHLYIYIHIHVCVYVRVFIYTNMNVDT